MNKYERAFNEIKLKLAFYRVKCNEEQTSQDVLRLVTLRELINKVTPQKVLKKDGRVYCPICMSSYSFMPNYCPVCGQRIEDCEVKNEQV